MYYTWNMYETHTLPEKFDHFKWKHILFDFIIQYTIVSTEALKIFKVIFQLFDTTFVVWFAFYYKNVLSLDIVHFIITKFLSS